MRGVIDLHETVACVLTGHLLKDPELTLAYHQGDLGNGALANPPIVVDPDLESLARAMEPSAEG